MSKELVLYFSVYGTAKNVAEEIAKQTGADLREIVPAVPYDGNRDHYPALLRVAQKEHDTDARPGIKEELPIAEYVRHCSLRSSCHNRIIIGTEAATVQWGSEWSFKVITQKKRMKPTRVKRHARSKRSSVLRFCQQK